MEITLPDQIKLYYFDKAGLGDTAEVLIVHLAPQYGFPF